MATFKMQIRGLEIASAHDGLLRGAPDPVLLCATYAVKGSKAALLSRKHLELKAQTRQPSFIEAKQAMRHEVPGADRFIVLVAAFEEDGGRDVQRVYGVLEAANVVSAGYSSAWFTCGGER